MELILDLYDQPYDPDCPVVCFDECSRQLTDDLHEPLPMKPGAAKRVDYAYERRGPCNLFVTVEPKNGSNACPHSAEARNCTAHRCIFDCIVPAFST